jgi:hypothetical protein
MPVILARPSFKNSCLMANTLTWSRVPLPTSRVISNPLWIVDFIARGSKVPALIFQT